MTGTLAGLFKKGKIGGFGFSEIAPSSLRRANAMHHVMAVQSEYSLAVRFPELGLVQSTRELGTALVAFSPVGRSLLTDRPCSPEKADTLPFLKVNPRFRSNLTANMKLANPSASWRRIWGPAQHLAIAWLIQQGDHVIHSAPARLTIFVNIAPERGSILMPPRWLPSKRHFRSAGHMVTAIRRHSSGPEKYCDDNEDHHRQSCCFRQGPWPTGAGMERCHATGPCPVEGVLPDRAIAADHAADLHDAYMADLDGVVWDAPIRALDSPEAFKAF